jgi:hypothetical protein
MAALLEALPAEMVDRLLEIAFAQTAAIDSWDLESFQGLLDERSHIQSAVEQLDAGTHTPDTLGTLVRIAEIDRENISRVVQMIEETNRSLDELHRGQMALNGYGKPGTQPIHGGSLVDTMR